MLRARERSTGREVALKVGDPSTSAARFHREGQVAAQLDRMRRLAACYREGAGVERDPQRSTALLHAAVERDNVRAMVDLADQLWAQDSAEARRLCETAAAQGSELARKRLREHGF